MATTENLNTSRAVLRAAVAARIPAMLVGDPGTSKTAEISALAKEMGYELITLIASRMDPQDVSGFPTRGTYVTDEGQKPVTEFAPQVWQMEILAKRKVFVFLDEFSNAHPSVKASMLSLIQDRQFPNGDLFPEETVIVGAMNPTDSAADGYELDPATSNRMMFIPWKPDTASWLEGMKDNWGKGVANENEQAWRRRIVNFITDNPGRLHQMPGKDAGNGESYGLNLSDPSEATVFRAVFPTRRSWNNVAQVLGAMPEGSPYLEDSILTSTVGASAAAAFRDWISKNSDLDVASIVAAPKKFDKWDELDIDEVNLVGRAAMDTLKENGDLVAAGNLLDIFDIFHGIGKESMLAHFINDLTTQVGKLVAANAKTGSAEEREAMRKRAFKTLTAYNNVKKHRF